MRGGPQRTGRVVGNVDLVGMLLPWAGNEPVILTPRDSDDLLLPCFSNETTLRRGMADVGIGFNCIKVIKDHLVFLDDVPRDVLIVVDLKRVGDAYRYLQVVRPAPMARA